MEDSHVKIACLLGTQEPVVAFLEFRVLDVLVSKRFNNSDAREIIFYLRVDLGDLYPVLPESLAHALVEHICKPEHERKHYKRSES